VGVGSPSEHILRLVDARNVNLIALSCAQVLAPGHAAVVRELLTRTHVPLLIVPSHLVRRAS
jgi:hypothetical protein